MTLSSTTAGGPNHYTLHCLNQSMRLYSRFEFVLGNRRRIMAELF